MSKSAGRCVFCRNRGTLTHGHIWPKWLREVMPFDDTHHVHLIGHFETFKARFETPTFTRTVRQGHGTTRKPRNTCKQCNSGWMSRIEGAAKDAASRLIRGETIILDRAQQMLVASLLGAYPAARAASSASRR